jgi:hypothetical protein
MSYNILSFWNFALNTRLTDFETFRRISYKCVLFVQKQVANILDHNSSCGYLVINWKVVEVAKKSFRVFSEIYLKKTGEHFCDGCQ